MNDIIDEQEIATGLTSRAIDRLLSYGEKKLKFQWARYRNKAKASFSQYVAQKVRMCSSVRNFIYDSESAHLSEIFVSMQLTRKGEKLDEEGLLGKVMQQSSLPDGSNALHAFVRGSAGAGKSMLLRYLFVNTVQRAEDLIPIFVELRDLNERKGAADLEKIILEDLVSISGKVMPEQVNDGLENGLFAVYLDGFDELDPEKEKEYGKAIVKFVQRFPRCTLIVSGRPQFFVKTWELLKFYDIGRFSLDDTKNLIGKLDFDSSIKKEFLSQIDDQLHRTHAEFLAIPLLATVMLITFSDVGRIAVDRHEFFDDAFNALWSKHDAKKRGFERKRYSGLKKSEFLFCLAAFSAVTYVRGAFNFTDDTIEKASKISKELTGIDFDEGDFFKDATVSTSIIVPDGGHYRFVHRTFQEYFTAVYIINLPDNMLTAALEEIAERQQTDSVFDFVFSMQREKLEKGWTIPHLKRVLSSIRLGRNQYDEYLDEVESDYTGVLSVIRRLYDFSPSNLDLQDGVFHTARCDLESGRKSSLAVEMVASDLDNLVTLQKELESRYNKQSETRSLIFGNGSII